MLLQPNFKLKIDYVYLRTIIKVWNFIFKDHQKSMECFI